ncbi:tetratricopeptide repeat protein [Candidatus Poribacteria bacterium]|nr:tetratricopeptide repeat protein [Candidatus Poribacteria bacterium]
MDLEAKNRENLDAIMRLMKRAVRSKQFALVFVNCNTLTDQNRYIKELRQHCLEEEITLTDIELWNRKPIENLRSVIVAYLNQEFPEGTPSRLAIQVTGLEVSILLDADERYPAVLQTMNLGREGYRRLFPHPLLIWLPDYAMTKLATVAPDFWSVRSGSYTFFSDEKTDPSDELERVVAKGNDLTTWQDKIGQIPLIERILEWKGTLPPETVTDLKLKLGDAYYFIGRLEKAQGCYEEALTSIPDADLDRKGTAFNGLGLVHTDLGNFSKAIDYLTRYLELREGQGKLDAQAVGYNHLGLAYHKQGDYDQAIAYYQQALQINQKIGKP